MNKNLLVLFLVCIFLVGCESQNSIEKDVNLDNKIESIDINSNLYPSKTFDLEHLEWNGDINTNSEDYYSEVLGDGVWAGFVNNYEASSYLVENENVLSPDNLKSFLDIDTCWAENVDGSGVGEEITVTSFASCEYVGYHNKDGRNHQDVTDYLLNEYNDTIDNIINSEEYIYYQDRLPEKITMENINNYHNILNSIGIINGYAKDDESWTNNNRVKKLKLTINDDAEYILNLDDSKDMQQFDISYKCELTKEIVLKFEILEVYNGEKYDDTCLTAIDVVGTSDNKWDARGGGR